MSPALSDPPPAEPPPAGPFPPPADPPWSDPVAPAEPVAPAGVDLARVRRAAAVLAAAVLGVSLLGVPLGLLWSALAGRVPVVKIEDGVYPAQPQPEGFVAADGWFSLLGLGFGVLVAVAGWYLLRRYRGPLGLTVAVLGSVGAALVAWRVGREIGLAGYQRLLETAPAGRIIDQPPDLRAGGIAWWHHIPFVRGNVLLSAFGAAVAYTLLAGWSRYPGLRSESEQAEAGAGDPVAGSEVGVPAAGSGSGETGRSTRAVSWDLAAGPAGTAEPEPPGPGPAAPPRD